MSSRLARSEAAVRLRSRIDHPEAILLSLLLAGLAALGWVESPLWLAVAIGLQLVIGGLGGVAIIGPIRPELGFARYATLAVAAVTVTLLGRMLVGVAGLPMALPAAILLWGVLRLEMRAGRTGTPGILLDPLALVGIVFAGTAGLSWLLPRDAWPPIVLLVAVVVAVPALRSAEGRGRSGVQAVGQALLHVVAVAQTTTAVALLDLPGVVGAAVVALAFHAWGGAAEALDRGASGRSVAVEFGSLAVLGVAVALLLHLR
ncbi:MAG TPA: hypothetical protein VFH63_09500 [candidate division Zixibacteria bacterium]|nr:hypothetical protein [candidate division Zixibacteria bacterium]